MENLVLWAGPVWASLLTDAALPAPSRVLTFSEYAGGIGSGSFANLGRDVGGDLGALCDRKGYDLRNAKTVTLAVFSAGWGLAEQLFRNPESLARLDAFVAADAYYTGQGFGTKPGYRAMVERAIARRALCVLSTSTNEGPGYPSAEAAVAHLLEPYQLGELPVPAALPRPNEAWGSGSLLWLKYGQSLGRGVKNHQAHATRVAPAVLSSIVTPYLQHRATLPPGALFAAFAVLLAASQWVKVA